MRTEINVITGEVTQHEDAPVTWNPTSIEPQPIIDPLDKLKQFLTDNPDVAQIINSIN